LAAESGLDAKSGFRSCAADGRLAVKSGLAARSGLGAAEGGFHHAGSDRRALGLRLRKLSGWSGLAG
jgi:hypothetical protein